MEFRPVAMSESEWAEQPPVLLPSGWDPREWGWEDAFNPSYPHSGHPLEILVRTQEDPDQTCWISFHHTSAEPDALGGPPAFTGVNPVTLHNPVIVHRLDSESFRFRVESPEQLQDLLTQVERHGYADPHADGWTVHASPTAAMAQDAVDQDHRRRLVRRDLNRADWVFADSAVPEPVPGTGPRPAPPAVVPEDNRMSRPEPTRETPDAAQPLRDTAKEILAAQHPKRAPDHDAAGPQQGLSHGGPRW